MCVDSWAVGPGFYIARLWRFARNLRAAWTHLLIERPFRLQLFNRPVEDIDIHVVFSAGNGVETGASIRRTAILLAGKLPERIGLPCPLWKICYVSLETRIPKLRLRKHLIRAILFRDCLGDFVVAVDERIAAGLFLDAFDEDARFVKAHVLRPIRAFEIERDQIIRRGLYRIQKKVGLLNRITRLSKMISAPFVPALLRLVPALTIFAVCPIANRRAMNDRHHALVSSKLLPINLVSFVRINRQRDVRVLPGLVEFGRL